MTSTELLTPGQRSAITRFDYTELDPETAVEAQTAVERIRALRVQQNEAIVAIGRELLTIKEKLRHGSFGRWLQAEFGMSASTAKRYINVAANLSEKIVTVTNFKPTTLYALAAKSTPQPLREEVATRIANGDPLSDDDIRQLLDQCKAARLTGEGHPGLKAESSAHASREAIHLAHQEAVMTMLSEAFDEPRLQELLVHLVKAGWGDGSAEHGLIQAIQQRCRHALARQEEGALAGAQDSSTGSTASPPAMGVMSGEDLPAQSSATETGEAAEGNVESVEPATAAAALPALALPLPSDATETADGTTTGTVDVVVSAQDTADAGLAAETKHEPVALATAPATPMYPNKASAAQPPAGTRGGKFRLYCHAPDGICRNSNCQLGKNGCARSHQSPAIAAEAA